MPPSDNSVEIDILPPLDSSSDDWRLNLNPFEQQKLPSMLKKRKQIVNELVQTEITYINCLNVYNFLTFLVIK